MTDYLLQAITKYFLPWAKKNIIPAIFGGIGLLLLLSGTIITINSYKKGETVSDTKILQIEKPQTEEEKIKIDISGQVINPGVYELTGDVRVQDGLIAAGGLSANADREWVIKNLNLAQKLTDGVKIYIPQVGEKTQIATINTLGASTSTSLISLNNATQAELESLDGIGPATAKKIIDGRSYSSTEEICTRKIITKSICDKIKEKITL